MERVATTCEGDTRAIAILTRIHASSFSVENVEPELLREHRGVSQVREERAGSYSEVEVYGGWLEHSPFGTLQSRFTREDDPDRGATVIDSHSPGFLSGENPNAAEGSAHWEGSMLGRDMGASPSRGQVMRGDADVTVDIGATGVTADVEFTDIVSIETGALRNDRTWRGMAVEEGGFARHDAPDDTIAGRFFGPDEEEVGGVFERNGIAGAFGGRRSSD